MKENSVDIIYRKIDAFGNFINFSLRNILLIFKKPHRLRLVLQNMEFIGNQSLMVIVLTGFATGSIFGLQTGEVFRVFNAESMIGAATGVALTTELAPLITGFLLAGRVGSAITAEISTMVVNEQVEALEVMAINPEDYLVVPRLIAGLCMMPLLCGIFMLVGEIGAFVVGNLFYNVDTGHLSEKLLILVKSDHVFLGLRKMLFFSVIITLVSTYFGLKASGGARGVGNATTNTVITTLITILFVDFIISYIEIRWLS